MTEVQREQIGDYVVERPAHAIGFWMVRMAGAEEYLSQHNTKKDAIAAIKRYIAGDKRRTSRRPKPGSGLDHIEKTLGKLLG